jgi:hypothetical protein
MAPKLKGKSLPPVWAGFAKVAAFVVVFFSAVPTYQQWFKSIQLHVPFHKVSEAEDQDRLWRNNKDCYKHATPIQVKTNANDALSVTVCPVTGDLLLDVESPASQKQVTRWIGLHDFEANWSAISPATAAAAEPPPPFEIAQLAAMVLCQRWLGPGIILRRVRYANGQCVDQQINTYSGLVMRAMPTACAPNC